MLIAGTPHRRRLSVGEQRVASQRAIAGIHAYAYACAYAEPNGDSHRHPRSHGDSRTAIRRLACANGYAYRRRPRANGDPHAAAHRLARADGDSCAAARGDAHSATRSAAYCDA